MMKCVLCVQDEVRVQKISKRMNTLEEVDNNVKLLGEMLSHYDKERSTDADRELIKVRSDSTHLTDAGQDR